MKIKMKQTEDVSKAKKIDKIGLIRFLSEMIQMDINQCLKPFRRHRGT